MAGWIKIHRELMEHWVAGDPDSLSVFLRLLCEANFVDKTQNINGSPVTIKRGQLIFGYPAFSVRSGITVARLRRVMKNLQKDGMIDRQNFSKFSIVSIVNYEQWQAEDRQATGRAQSPNRQSTTLEEGEEGEEGKKDPVVPSGDATKGYPSDFEKLWKAYPKRKGNSKKASHKAWVARIKAGASPDDLLTGVKAYAAYCENNGKIGTEFVKHAKTFLGPDEHYLADWSVSDCPHTDIVAAWNEEMPAHILRTAPDAWSPGSSGRDRLEVTWSILKAKMRKDKTGYVVQSPEQGAEWFRGVFRRLAKSPRLQDEASGQWCKLSWAVKNETIHDIAEGGYDQ